jgi:hypothetical protein
VSLNVILDDYDTAKKIYDFLKQNGRLMRTIRKGEPAEERSRIALERHYHDEDPTRPCEVIESFESE